MIEIRPARSGEEARLTALWQQVFGDSREAVDAFFRLYRPEDFLVLTETGRIVSMLALMPMTLLAPGRAPASAWYVYALATDPDRRGLGFARRLLAEAGGCLRRRGADCATVVPAEPSLHRFFGSTGFQPCFALQTWTLTPPPLPPGQAETSLRPAGPESYNTLRSALLTGHSWVRYETSAIQFQQSISRLSGAELHILAVDGSPGCAAVERVNAHTLLCKELLIAPALTEQAAAVLAAAYGASRCLVRAPAWQIAPAGGTVLPFGMVKWYNEAQAALWSGETQAYLGLGFD